MHDAIIDAVSAASKTYQTKHNTCWYMKRARSICNPSCHVKLGLATKVLCRFSYSRSRQRALCHVTIRRLLFLSRLIVVCVWLLLMTTTSTNTFENITHTSSETILTFALVRPTADTSWDARFPNGLKRFHLRSCVVAWQHSKMNSAMRTTVCMLAPPALEARGAASFLKLFSPLRLLLRRHRGFHGQMQSGRDMAPCGWTNATKSST